MQQEWPQGPGTTSRPWPAYIVKDAALTDDGPVARGFFCGYLPAGEPASAMQFCNGAELRSAATAGQGWQQTLLKVADAAFLRA